MIRMHFCSGQGHRKCSKHILVLLRFVAYGLLRSSWLSTNLRLLGDQEGLLAGKLGHLAVEIMQIFVVTAKISTLCKCLVADVATVGPRGRVFAEVVAQVAALGEDCRAVLVLAAEVELQAFCALVTLLNNLVPLSGNTFKIFYEW